MLEDVRVGWANGFGVCRSSSDSGQFLLLQSEEVADVGGCGVGVGQPGSGGFSSSDSSQFLLLQSEEVARVGGPARRQLRDTNARRKNARLAGRSARRRMK
jgi:hypothetical protein